MKSRANIAVISLCLILFSLLTSHASTAYAKDEPPPDDPIIVGDGILVVHTLPNAPVRLGCNNEQTNENADPVGLYKTGFIAGTVCVASNGYRVSVNINDGKVIHAYMVSRIFLAVIER